MSFQLSNDAQNFQWWSSLQMPRTRILDKQYIADEIWFWTKLES